MFHKVIFVALLSLKFASGMSMFSSHRSRQDYVHHFLMDIQKGQDLLKPIQHDSSGSESLKLQSYSFKNCSAADAEKATFVVRKLEITPDPILLPGQITISLDLNLLKDIDNLVLAIELWGKVGQRYVKFPCVGNLGSCTYDVCQLLLDVGDCPAELVAHKIDCRCPFRKNMYDVPGISAKVPIPVFMTGDYQVKATMTSGENFVGCYKFSFSIESE